MTKRVKLINLYLNSFLKSEKIKDELMENQDFIKDILKGIDSTDLNEDELKDVINQIKNDEEKNKDKDQEKK